MMILVILCSQKKITAVSDICVMALLAIKDLWNLNKDEDEVDIAALFLHVIK
jgi:hypothetical protein